MRTLLAVAVLLPVAILAAITTGPRTASACSLAQLTAQYIPSLVERTPVIAIGTWAQSQERQVTLIVDEGLKGAVRGDELIVDNRGTYTAFACSPYDEPFRSGHRFTDGQRSIVFLEQEVDGLWRIGWSSYAAFDVPADDLQPLSWFVENRPGELLRDVRATIASADAGLAVPALETELGCAPPYTFDVRRVADYTSLATSVALVTVVDSPAPNSGDPDAAVTAAVDEVLSGQRLAQTIALNDFWISDFYSGDCEPALEDGRRQLVEGQQYLVFLTTDEFGIADYRPVAWGKAIVSVNERWLAYDQPTLGLIRDLTARYRPGPSATELTEVPAAAPAGETSSPPTESDSTDSDAGRNSSEDDGGPMIPIVAGVATAALVVGLVFVARRRWLLRG